MAGVVLETLSTKKLSILVLTLFLGLIAFFLVGGLIAPAPYSTIVSTPITCVDRHEGLKKKPFIPRGGGSCEFVTDLSDPKIDAQGITANMIVFSQWLPLPRDDTQLQMSRWFQTMHTVIDIKVEYDPKNPLPDDKKPELMLDTTLYRRDASDGDQDWKEYASAKVSRRLDCTIDEEEKANGGGDYNCDLLPFFELGSVHYDFYLINIRIPVVSKLTTVNHDIGQIRDMQFITIFQNGGFTKVWFSLKTVLFPLTLAALVWFWRRIMQLSRPANLLERTLFSLGIILSIMNFPLEWLTLWADVPFMLLINDIREGAFYAMLLSFWLIFVGEHMMDQVERNKLQVYWKHLSAVIVACLALFIFDMCERGVQLSNPFYSIWASSMGTNMALAFIIMAGMAACGYFFFLSFMIFKVFRNISAKASSLPQMSCVRQKFYIGVIFRFKFLMITTLLCAALTVIFFIISQVSEGSWKWGDDGIALEYSSAFLTGVYGMWNMYTIALVCLYAPSHKVTATAAREKTCRPEEPGWNPRGGDPADPGAQ
ncbi:protein wntless homolog isoform X2 [Babylonia areolata]|uniref:protein wntless homolog isoform X2 n=1 Tax=Babylonia areolata TaxID=304850 RepID=UPI003FD5C4AE